MIGTSPKIGDVTCTTLRIPTDAPEADGTLEWNSTTVLLVEIVAGGKRGRGYSYCAAASAEIVRDILAKKVVGKDCFGIPSLWNEMVQAVRNAGWPGVCANAISATDVALWDLKARLFDQPLVMLLGVARHEVPIYGSGGFTSYDEARLREQLGRWVSEEGCQWVKMKVGSDPAADLDRVAAARDAIGAASLFVDANGAYARKQALSFAQAFADLDVTWLEEPVSSDDLEGLALIRDQSPAPMEIAAGEYGYTPFYFKRMIEAGAVDVIQADATRCGGITGFLKVAALADAYHIPLSAHTAPSLHLHVCCAAQDIRHVEWFHDHVRIEHLLFDGVPEPSNCVIKPDLSRPGHGLELKQAEVERLAA